MKAILSDIHGNLEALHAVLADIARVGVDSIYNLGDIVGYGPDPIACIDLSMNMTVVLQGNFDYVLFLDATARRYPIFAERSLIWNKQLLDSTSNAAALQHRRVEFLQHLPSSHNEGDVLFVHGSPGNEDFAGSCRDEYIVPEDIYCRPKMARIGRQFDHVCFNGHTHLPGLHVERGPEEWLFISPEECGGSFKLDDRKVICNVGSVGQPRDGEWRACYVLFDGTTITYRRVEYDIETTINKIYALPELDNFLGDRLRTGR